MQQTSNMVDKIMINDWVFTTEEYYGEYYESRGGRNTRKCEMKPFRIEEADDFYLADSFSPIPITYEFLKKNEFKVNDNLCVLETNYTHIQIVFRDTFCKLHIVIDNGDKTTDVQMFRDAIFVHELQQTLRLCGLNSIADNFTV